MSVAHIHMLVDLEKAMQNGVQDEKPKPKEVMRRALVDWCEYCNSRLDVGKKIRRVEHT